MRSNISLNFAIRSHTNRYAVIGRCPLTISDPKDASLIKKLLAKFDSVTISKTKSKRKTGLDEALDDVAAGRVYHAKDVDDLFRQLNS